MDLVQLKYFEMIAKYQNLSRAAEELHVAQPALSSGLGRMENQFGVQLFDRYKGRLLLNKFGRIFLKYVKDINVSFDEAIHALEQEKLRSYNNVCIALFDWGFCPDLISDFAAQYPEIILNTFMLSRNRDFTDEIDNYDLVITPLPETFPNALYIPLIKDEITLAVAPGHRLYEKDRIRLKDLDNEHILCMGFQSHYGNFIKNLIKNSGILPKCLEGCIAQNAVDLLNTKHAVAPVVPGIKRLMGNLEGIRFLSFNPPVFRQTGIGYSLRNIPSSAAKKFCGFACAYCSNLPNSVVSGEEQI